MRTQGKLVKAKQQEEAKYKLVEIRKEMEEGEKKPS